MRAACELGKYQYESPHGTTVTEHRRVHHCAGVVMCYGIWCRLDYWPCLDAVLNKYLYEIT